MKSTKNEKYEIYNKQHYYIIWDSDMELVKNKKITALDALILSFINARAQSWAFYGSNEYLAEAVGCSVAMIKKTLSKLQKLGIIECETRKAGDKDKHRRYIHILKYEGRDTTVETKTFEAVKAKKPIEDKTEDQMPDQEVEDTPIDIETGEILDDTYMPTPDEIMIAGMNQAMELY